MGIADFVTDISRILKIIILITKCQCRIKTGRNIFRTSEIINQIRFIIPQFPENKRTEIIPAIVIKLIRIRRYNGTGIENRIQKTPGNIKIPVVIMTRIQQKRFSHPYVESMVIKRNILMYDIDIRQNIGTINPSHSKSARPFYPGCQKLPVQRSPNLFRRVIILIITEKVKVATESTIDFIPYRIAPLLIFCSPVAEIIFDNMPQAHKILIGQFNPGIIQKIGRHFRTPGKLIFANNRQNHLVRIIFIFSHHNRSIVDIIQTTK